MDDVLKRNHRIRKLVGIFVMLIIASIFGFRIGNILNGNLYIYYQSYAGDLMIPFGAYFLLCMNEIQLQFLRKWFIKALIVFCVMTFSEIMQLFGLYLFGVTFDLADILMYGIGVILAVFFDKQIFEKILPFWKYNPEKK
ncbi:MAG: hypothetical protein HN704_00860 [Bacteroidetes bacterium]|jgi:hypothetical protein|nr:hypothetical protein [Bacteroidota bacterium]MBT6687399.1 hypothetical protein [Bacteroidota bacterium]MBT7142597.1 hypothetical protein [Bacteroidota bacterium]MBT7490134.1 hypothetical protein [Bacteroidota bacterium]